MSIWDSVKKFTRPYGDDEYDDYDEDEMDGYEEEAPRRSRNVTAEPEASTYTASATAAQSSSRTGFNGQVVTSNKIQLILARPESFNDAPIIAANMRAKKAVVLNLEGVEKNLARRVVDFLSGCGYALDGSVKKVSQSTYVFCPHNMEVLGDLKNLQGEVENYV